MQEERTGAVPAVEGSGGLLGLGRSVVESAGSRRKEEAVLVIADC